MEAQTRFAKRGFWVSFDFKLSIDIHQIATLFVEEYFLSDPELKGDIIMGYLGHKEKYEEAVRRSMNIMMKIKKLQSEGRDVSDLIRCLIFTTLEYSQR